MTNDLRSFIIRLMVSKTRARNVAAKQVRHDAILAAALALGEARTFATLTMHASPYDGIPIRAVAVAGKRLFARCQGRRSGAVGHRSLLKRHGYGATIAATFGR